jgi:hypothetical protein
MIPIRDAENRVRHIPSPSWIRIQENGFLFIQGPHPNSSGRFWECQIMSERKIILYHVPTTPFRLVLLRTDWHKPPEWLAKLFEHCGAWMRRAEVSS